MHARHDRHLPTKSDCKDNGADIGEAEIQVPRDRMGRSSPSWWQNRPLDAVYPVVFVDCVNVKIRDGQVANRPIYVALAVTSDGHRDILGLRAGEHGDGEGGELLAAGAERAEEPRMRRNRSTATDIPEHR